MRTSFCAALPATDLCTAANRSSARSSERRGEAGSLGLAGASPIGWKNMARAAIDKSLYGLT